MTLLIKFVATFALVGLIVSTVFGIVGGNRIAPLIVTSLVCTLLSAAVGGGAYKILEQRVPEILELFQSSEGYADGEFDDAEYGEGEGVEFAGGEGGEMDGEEAGGAGDSDAFGDHIIVNKIKIKNEPKLLAEAIRTMMARDEE